MTDYVTEHRQRTHTVDSPPPPPSWGPEPVLLAMLCSSLDLKDSL